MSTFATPTTWKSAKWWRNRPPEEREFFMKAPKRYTDYTGRWQSFVSPEDFPLGENFLLYGRPGTGKTTSAVNTVREIVKARDLSARFISSDEYVEMIKDTFDNEGELPEMWSSPHLIKYIKGVFDIVILDGLGQERTTEFAKHELGSLIRRRYEMGLTTIITTDIPLTDIKARYGDRVGTAILDYKEIRSARQ
jgi:DNA replication protein DnaC